jgi:hypothetical protein
MGRKQALQTRAGNWSKTATRHLLLVCGREDFSALTYVLRNTSPNV